MAVARITFPDVRSILSVANVLEDRRPDLRAAVREIRRAESRPGRTVELSGREFHALFDLLTFLPPRVWDPLRLAQGMLVAAEEEEGRRPRGEELVARARAIHDSLKGEE